MSTRTSARRRQHAYLPPAHGRLAFVASPALRAIHVPRAHLEALLRLEIARPEANEPIRAYEGVVDIAARRAVMRDHVPPAREAIGAVGVVGAVLAVSTMAADERKTDREAHRGTDSDGRRRLHGNATLLRPGTSVMRLLLAVLLVGTASANPTPDADPANAEPAKVLGHVKGMSEAQRGVELTPPVEYRTDATRSPSFGGGTSLGMVTRPPWHNDMRPYDDGGMVIRPPATDDHMVIAPGTDWLTSGPPYRRLYTVMKYGADKRVARYLASGMMKLGTASLSELGRRFSWLPDAARRR